MIVPNTTDTIPVKCLRRIHDDKGTARTMTTTFPPDHCNKSSWMSINRISMKEMNKVLSVSESKNNSITDIKIDIDIKHKVIIIFYCSKNTLL